MSKLRSRAASIRWLSGILLLILAPAMSLAWLAVLSVKDSEALLEQKYEQQLRDGLYSLVKEVDKKTLSTADQAKVYAQQMLDLRGKHFAYHSQNTVPIGLEGVFVFRKGELQYPFLSMNVGVVENLSWSMDSSEIRSFDREIQGAHKQKSLLERKNQLEQNQKNLFARLGMLRVMTQLGQHGAVASSIQDWMPKLSRNDSFANEVKPSLWLLRYRSLVAEKKWAEAQEWMFSSSKEFLNQPKSFRLEKVQMALMDMMNDVLQMEHLAQSRRDSVLNMKANLQVLINQSLALRDFRPLLENQVLPFVGGDQFKSLRLGDKSIQIIAMDSLESGYFLVALYDSKKLDSTLFSSLAVEPWKSLSVTVGPLEQPYFSHAYKGEGLELYQSKELSSLCPLGQIHVYRAPVAEIREQAEKRSRLLYAILGISLLTICLSIYLAVRTVQGERSVYRLKTNILSSITHELKTPLTSIRMFAETLEGGRFRTTEQAQNYAKMITRESGRLQMLIDDILVYGRLESGQQPNFAPVELEEVLAEVVHRLDPIAKGKRISLLYYPEIKLRVKGDRSLLESLFQNLLDNAVKYTLADGQVDLRLYQTESGDFEVSVKDNGVGIPSKELNRIFDAFYRVGDELTRRAKGSGIGLAIVRKAVEVHGTKIRVESQEGVGSVFVVLFPKEICDATHHGR